MKIRFPLRENWETRAKKVRVSDKPLFLAGSINDPLLPAGSIFRKSYRPWHQRLRWLIVHRVSWYLSRALRVPVRIELDPTIARKEMWDDFERKEKARLGQ